MYSEFSIADIDVDIAFVQQSLSLYPQSRSIYINGINLLMQARFARYERSQEKEDLDKCIVHCTDAILLPPVSGREAGSKIVLAFIYLASALSIRFLKLKRFEDSKSSIMYFRYLRGLTLDSFGVSKDLVTTSLVQELAIRVEAEDVDGTRNIEEIVVLCRELLTSDLSAIFPVAAAFKSLNDAVCVEFSRGRVQSLDQVIECLRDAVKICPPGSYDVLYALANTLFNRYLVNHSKDDYEEAKALFERINDLNQPGECPDSIREQASFLATMLAMARPAFFTDPQYSEVKIPRLRTLLSSSSVDEQLRLQVAERLAEQARQRFGQYGLAESLEEANSYTSQIISSFQSLEKIPEVFHFPVPDAVRESYPMTRMAEKIQHLEELHSNTPPGTLDHKVLLIALSRWYETKFSRTKDISDIEESIMYLRLYLNATRFSGSGWWGAGSVFRLRKILLLAFKGTNKINYLDESITLDYHILESEDEQCTQFFAIKGLVGSLLTRSRLLGRREDIHEALRLMPLAVDNESVQEHERFIVSCEWAFLARCINHPTTFTAYKTAMSLIQKSLSFAPTVSVQHTRLVAMGEIGQNMPLDYASYQIHLGRFEEAIETLEQGRALLWSEMRGFRTPMAQLVEEDSPLATRFAEINQELEALTISVAPSGRPEMIGDVTQGRDGTDPFGRLMVKRQKLVEEWDVLVSRIRGRPGLEEFLKAPSFATLHSSALRGPVILINHCRWRSDISIIFPNSLPCSIPTADDFYARANQLRDVLVEARKHGLDSGEYQDALCSVLKDLYELVGKPVIKRLRLLGVPEQSRIWWCPTSVFCSLPLHAMGPIPSGHTSNERYFSDLYIPSYTPSLSALIESRKASAQLLERPSLLLVAQPEDSLPGVNGEIKVIQRALKTRATVTGLVSSEATPTSVVEGLRGSRFAHFACHGVLETGKPFEASFKLHGGSRLTLLEIVRSQLPDAEFAFLSCCHTAEITEESVADETLHLTAAMQYCGFRSVVGTSWAMADTDGRDLAKNFYKSLFSGPEGGVPYYERSARALRDATRKLRKKARITIANK